jgi:hypothetical protein
MKPHSILNTISTIHIEPFLSRPCIFGYWPCEQTAWDALRGLFMLALDCNVLQKPNSMYYLRKVGHVCGCTISWLAMLISSPSHGVTAPSQPKITASPSKLLTSTTTLISNHLMITTTLGNDSYLTISRVDCPSGGQSTSFHLSGSIPLRFINIPYPSPCAPHLLLCELPQHTLTFSTIFCKIVALFQEFELSVLQPPRQ